MRLRLKFRKKILETQLDNVRFILAIGGLSDIFFIIATLRKYDLLKQLFVLELEQGQEVFIPPQLSCDKFPLSFQYYDPIIQIVNQLFSSDSKSYFQYKTEFRLNKLKQTNFKEDVLRALGLLEDSEQKKRKMSYKHSLIN